MEDDGVYARLAEMQDEIREQRALLAECSALLGEIVNFHMPIAPQTYKAILNRHAVAADRMRGKIAWFEQKSRLRQRPAARSQGAIVGDHLPEG